MKKLIITLLALAGPGAFLFAQNFQFETYNFDLEKNNLHKGFRLYSGFRDPDNNYVVKLGKAACELSAQSGSKIGSMVYTYHGVSYTFHELKFDENFNYLGQDVKFFPTTIETIPYEPVHGKRIWPLYANMYFRRPLTPEYVGTTVIVPQYGLGGLVVKSFTVGGQALAPGGSNFGKNYYSCSEILELQGERTIKAKENKGERWMAVDHYPIPNGGIIVFVTDAIKENPDKANFVVKKFDAELNELAKVVVPVDFKSAARILPIERSNGTRDFLLIAMAQSTKYSPGKKVVPLTEGMFIVLSGSDLKVKSESSFQMPYTRWYIEDIFLDEKENIYVFGSASESKEENFTAFTGMSNINNVPKKQPNFQLLKADASGKVQYVKAVDKTNSKGKVVVVTGAGKADTEVIFNTYDFNKTVFFTDKYLIIAGQQFIGIKGGGAVQVGPGKGPEADKGNLFLALFDKETGEMVKYFIKPEEVWGHFDIVFDKNKQNLYWAAYDWKKYNDADEQSVKPKEIKSMIAGKVYLSKIDLNTLSATDFVDLGKEEWAVSFDAPLLVGDSNDEYMIFQGRTLNKKAKDSELIFVKVRK